MWHLGQPPWTGDPHQWQSGLVHHERLPANSSMLLCFNNGAKMDFLCLVLLSICDIEGACGEEMYVEDQMGSLRHKKQEDREPTSHLRYREVALVSQHCIMVHSGGEKKHLFIISLGKKQKLASSS